MLIRQPIGPTYQHTGQERGGVELELSWSLLWAVCFGCPQIKGIFERADKEHKGALGMEEFLTMLCEFMRSRLKVGQPVIGEGSW